jgi:glycosyltransferase involved in cell wall biosynthesis
MKVAFYGNNLNFGYFFVRMLRQQGLQAKLICPQYRYPQEQHSWWTDTAARPDWIYPIPSVPIGWLFPLTTFSTVRELYREFASYDLLLLAEEGPAVFSELARGPARLFVALGFDMTHLPFYLKHLLAVPGILRFFGHHLKWATQGDWSAAYELGRFFDRFPREIPRRIMIQHRQRRGLKQCHRLVCGPHHIELLNRIGLDRDKVRFLPLPMDTEVLAEVEPDCVQKLRQAYSQDELVFFHPTRHYYLCQDNDIFLKGNDKLLRAFAQFMAESKKRVRLLLIRKGRKHDLRRSEQLVAALHMEHAVQWLPEMPNKALRAYYSLPQAVICDQFSPQLAVLGNIGREASYFGRPLITAFRPWNRLRYGSDRPPHILAAETTEQILAAMRRIEAMTTDQLSAMGRSGAAWFQRNHAPKSVLPRWVQLISSCAC